MTSQSGSLATIMGRCRMNGSEAPVRLIACAAAITLVLMGVYTASIDVIPITTHRVLGLALSVVAVVLGGYGIPQPISGDRSRGKLLRVLADIALLAVLLYAIARFSTVLYLIEYEFYVPGTLDIAVAFAGLIILLEIGRRIWGLPLVIVALLFISYLVFGHLLPSSIGHRYISWQEISTSLWYGYQGIFSSTLSAVLNIVIVYVLFGVLLEATGAGDVLLKIAFAVTGRSRGGPAHAAIVASSLFGTISGSTVANVVGTGTFTIPMIKKRGFPPEFAGGIEATASSGGQIVPPIMGAAAFIMADVIGMPYITVAIAAIVPALLYYLNLYFSVTFEARKRNIQPVPPEERPKITLNDLVRSLQFLVPIIIVVGMMLAGRSVPFAGICATISVIVLGFLLNEELRTRPMKLLSS